MTDFTISTLRIPGNHLATLHSFRNHLFAEGADPSVMVLPFLFVRGSVIPEIIDVPAQEIMQKNGCLYLCARDMTPEFHPLGPIVDFPFKSLFIGWGKGPQARFPGIRWKPVEQITVKITCVGTPWWKSLLVDSSFLA